MRTPPTSTHGRHRLAAGRTAVAELLAGSRIRLPSRRRRQLKVLVLPALSLVMMGLAATWLSQPAAGNRSLGSDAFVPPANPYAKAPALRPRQPPTPSERLGALVAAPFTHPAGGTTGAVSPTRLAGDLPRLAPKGAPTLVPMPPSPLIGPSVAREVPPAPVAVESSAVPTPAPSSSPTPSPPPITEVPAPTPTPTPTADTLPSPTTPEPSPSVSPLPTGGPDDPAPGDSLVPVPTSVISASLTAALP